MISKFRPNLNFKNGFVILAVITGMLMPVLSLDYGMTEDARVHHEHGKRILDYFKGLDDKASLSPLDEKGNLVNISLSDQYLFKGMNGFGGSFDFLCNFLYQYVDFVGEYEFRNIISAILGFLLFLFCGLIGKEIGGWRIGFFALVFVLLTPVLFGQAMNSPKDVPFAAFYVFCIFHLVKLIKELPIVSFKRGFFLIFNISILVNIRLVGLVFFGYLLLFVFLWWVLENYNEGFKKIRIKETLLIVSKILIVAVLSYFAISAFWPYVQTNPLSAPIELFFKVKEYKGFISTQVFEGVWRNSYDMPWYYAFKSLLYIAIPLHVLIGMVLIPIVYFKTDKRKLLLPSLVLFTSLFPLVLMILGKANSYDHSRQFLFTVAPMIIVGAFAWGKMLDFIPNNRTKNIVFAGLTVLLFQPLLFMIRNHPFQAAYFSPVVGGVEGAYGMYEIDYLGIGIKPAIEWLEKNIDSSSDQPARIRMYYGEQLKARYYLDKIPHLSYVLARKDSPDWDYGIVMLTEAKFDQNLEGNWPPKNTVYQVEVDNVPICFVVKNDYKMDDVAALEAKLNKNPNSQGYVQLSLLYYNQSDYFNSIKASRRAISLDSKNSLAYNNLCSAYNMLLMYDEAEKAGKRAVELSPNMAIAINNLKVSREGIERRKNNEFLEEEYLSLSFNYYKLRKYKKCIVISNELLMMFPGNSVAYNNICSSFNELGQYINAVDACKKALELSPEFKLAENNLKFAESNLSN
ncbi:hypothetical protein ATO12_18140 [Aquimarina atlantica]|uniref:Uncharacterized protein n=1 Tax=Aquimarina atlantica TaxID=1317122 RepID=A0A023BSI5_9FLAO|nr:hypothetical protein [Aquimarina atlantica]EZH72941.1 hypothetical protein ATO12_18140 [Aquimarina atlantica]